MAHVENGCGMPRPFADHKMGASAKVHQHPARVPSIVQPDHRQPGCLGQSLELICESSAPHTGSADSVVNCRFVPLFIGNVPVPVVFLSGVYPHYAPCASNQTHASCVLSHIQP